MDGVDEALSTVVHALAVRDETPQLRQSRQQSTTLHPKSLEPFIRQEHHYQSTGVQAEATAQAEPRVFFSVGSTPTPATHNRGGIAQSVEAGIPQPKIRLSRQLQNRAKVITRTTGSN
jgi:hypothetical protein